MQARCRAEIHASKPNPTRAKRRRRGAVAGDAEGAEVFEVGVAAFDDGEDVVGFPPGFARLVDRAEGLQGFELAHAGGEGEAHDAASEFVHVGFANGANAAVALKHAFAQVGRTGSQSPFVHAGVGAEGAAATGDGGFAPAAWGTFRGHCGYCR